MSEWLEAEYGWTRVDGVYTTADYKEPIVTGHYWNLLPDGSILDATADQLGEGDDIRVVPPSSPTYHRYRPEFNADYDDDVSAEQHQDYLRTYFPHWDQSTLHRNGDDDYDWEQRLDKERGLYWPNTSRRSCTLSCNATKLYGWPQHESFRRIREIQKAYSFKEPDSKLDYEGTNFDQWSIRNDGRLIGEVMIQRGRKVATVRNILLYKGTETDRFVAASNPSMGLFGRQRSCYQADYW